MAVETATDEPGNQTAVEAVKKTAIIFAFAGMHLSCFRFYKCREFLAALSPVEDTYTKSCRTACIISERAEAQ